MSPTVYLVTGAGRGIGYTFVEQLAARPDTVIYAGIRSFPPPSDSPLGQLAAKLPQVVIPIKITSGDVADNATAAAAIKAKYGKVDIVIANAGVTSGFTSPLTVTPEQLRSDFEVNTVGTIVLYQAVNPLLLAAQGPAKFVVISTAAAQIADAIPWPVAAYGASKAALNFLTKKIHQEAPELVVFPIHPGLVGTDMGNGAATAGGKTIEELGGITPLQSVTGVLAVVDQSTRETHGGKFWNEKGEEITY